MPVATCLFPSIFLLERRRVCLPCCFAFCWRGIFRFLFPPVLLLYHGHSRIGLAGNSQVTYYGFPCVSLGGIPYKSSYYLIAVTNSYIPLFPNCRIPYIHALPRIAYIPQLPVYSPHCLCIPVLPDCPGIPALPLLPIAYDCQQFPIALDSWLPLIAGQLPVYVSLGAKPYDLNSPYNYIR